MLWKKLGQIYIPEPVHPKLISHAANPLPFLLGGDIYRVFYSGRDVQNRSSVGYVDIDIIKRKIVNRCARPSFEYGSAQSFYSHGVSIGNSYEVNGVCYILFMGWQCPEGGHWRGDIGRLRVNSDMSLVLDDEQPYISTNEVDRLSLSYPWVLKTGDDLYRMWYGSTVTWDAGNNEMLHVINHAISIDGHNWKRKGLCVPYELGVAQAFSRPSVVQIHDKYHMWFSYRSGAGESYRIGYANSIDAEEWYLDLSGSGISTSVSGWDSEMIEYPFVLFHKDHYYMFYNGNDYGRSGFGLAVLFDD